jgi:hypothetical protein
MKIGIIDITSKYINIDSTRKLYKIQKDVPTTHTTKTPGSTIIINHRQYLEKVANYMKYLNTVLMGIFISNSVLLVDKLVIKCPKIIQKNLTNCLNPKLLGILNIRE